MADKNFPTPHKGLLTWKSEGTEGGPNHSRKFHVPGGASGCTLGRGYDMGGKSKSKIKGDLMSAGVSEEHAEKISGCSMKKGSSAKKFIKDNKLDTYEISPKSQKALFEISYLELKADAKRICSKPDVEAKYGRCNWQGIHPKIKELLIDLRFRGDYSPTTRNYVQRAIVTNDFEELVKIMSNRSLWSNVPDDRFNRRKIFIIKAYEAEKPMLKMKSKGKSKMKMKGDFPFPRRTKNRYV